MIPSSNALASLVADLSDLAIVTDPRIVRRRSRDFFWYSPVLNEQLNGKSANLARLAAERSRRHSRRRERMRAASGADPAVRAGGTGNYGQAVPLHGGVLLDIMALDAIRMDQTRP